MESVDTKAFWKSMMMGLTAQEYVERGLATIRQAKSLDQNASTYSAVTKECLGSPENNPPRGQLTIQATLSATASKIITTVWEICVCCGMEFNESSQSWRGTPSHLHERYGLIPVVDVATSRAKRGEG